MEKDQIKKVVGVHIYLLLTTIIGLYLIESQFTLFYINILTTTIAALLIIVLLLRVLLKKRQSIKRRLSIAALNLIIPIVCACLTNIYNHCSFEYAKSIVERIAAEVKYKCKSDDRGCVLQILSGWDRDISGYLPQKEVGWRVKYPVTFYRYSDRFEFYIYITPGFGESVRAYWRP